MSTHAELFDRVVALMARLRAPDGCPWDRKQTFDSIRTYTLEETYEVLEAIGDRNWPALEEELGDLLLQVLFYSQMADEQGLFTISGVLQELADKLVRRHPHVFEDDAGQRMDAAEALGRWEAIKAGEKKARREAAVTPATESIAPTPTNGAQDQEDEPEPPLLGSVPRGLPAVAEALKLSKRAASIGFDWGEAEQVLDKLEEEIAELRQEIRTQADLPRLEDELGDLLFTVVNIARVLHLEPESALKRTNRKFRQRFGRMEENARQQGRSLREMPLEEMEDLWQQAKRRS
jgi:MazG family protein